MRNIKPFSNNGKTLRKERTILSVGQIMQQYLTNGQIPAAMNSRPFEFEAEMDDKGHFHAKDFESFDKDLHPDLFKAVSRESREASAKKAAIAAATPTPSQVVTDHVTEPVQTS